MTVSSAVERGRLRIFLSGELDHHAAHSAISTIGELIDEVMPRECVLDLKGLGFMDSSGIAVIAKAREQVYAIGGRLRIENALSQPKRVIDAAGIDRLVPVAVGGGESL